MSSNQNQKTPNVKQILKAFLVAIVILGAASFFLHRRQVAQENAIYVIKTVLDEDNKQLNSDRYNT